MNNQNGPPPDVRPRRRWWRPFEFPFISWQGFLTMAVVLGVMYLAGWLAGLQSHTTALTGSLATADSSREMSSILGCLYLVLYFSFLLVVPVFLIASGILYGVPRTIGILRKTHPRKENQG